MDINFKNKNNSLDRLIIEIYKFLYKKKSIKITYKQLAKEFSAHPKTIQKKLRKLEKINYIKRDFTKDNQMTIELINH